MEYNIKVFVPSEDGYPEFTISANDVESDVNLPSLVEQLACAAVDFREQYTLAELTLGDDDDDDDYPDDPASGALVPEVCEDCPDCPICALEGFASLRNGDADGDVLEFRRAA